MPTWSMVWLAPVPRSTGGRSAESRSRGTPDIDASTTAGNQFATAVPEVQTRATGRGEECVGAFVQVQGDRDAAVPGEGEGDRGGARPGGDAGVPEAEAVELAGQLSHAGESDVAVRRRGGGGHDEEASRRSGANRRGTSLPWTGSRGRAVTSSASRAAVPMP